MRFAEALSQRGHQIRIITCGDPLKSGKDPDTGFEMFYLPELKIPIASRLAHKQNTLFAKPVRSILKKAISGSDVVHIYQPWPLGSAAQRVARQMNIPAIAAFHIQPENITFNIGLKRFSPAAHLTYFLFYLFSIADFHISTARQNLLPRSSGATDTKHGCTSSQTASIRHFVLPQSPGNILSNQLRYL